MFGLTNQGWRLNDYNRHLAAFLGRNGFETAIFGSHHVVDHNREGYEMLPYMEKSTQNPETATADRNATTDDVIAYLKKPKDKPFFLSLGYDFNHRARWENARENSLPLWGPIDSRYVRPLPLHPDVPETRAEAAVFYRAVRYVDHLFGRVMAALDEAGLREDTLVIFTTDHGIGLPRIKKEILEGGSGVALILRGPNGFTGGKVIEGLTHHIDLYPTLCELLNIEKPDWLEGESLLPLVSGEKEELRDAVFLQQNYHANYVPLRGLRTRRYKYIRRIGPERPIVDYVADKSVTKDFMVAAGWGNDPMPAEQLYDLYLDPNENVNLAGDPLHRETLSLLQARLERFMEETDDPAATDSIPYPPVGIRT
jgi:arylsulfatase A-like enzyme